MQPKFASAIGYYGWDKFEHIIWAENLNHEDACKAEKMLIKLYDSVDNGYNCSEGGEGYLGYNPSKETRDKMRKAKSGKYFAEDNPFFGKKHTEETKRKISETHKGLLAGRKHPRARKVIQLNLNNIFIKEWDYIKQVTECLGYNDNSIRDCCKKRHKTAYGYKWMYYDEWLSKNGAKTL